MKPHSGEGYRLLIYQPMNDVAQAIAQKITWA